MLLQSLYFSRFLPNRPRPLSGFETHAIWQPVTQCARSRWSYGKIGDCEQSKLFMIFLILVSCKNKVMSASYLQQKFMSSSRFLSLFLRSFGSFSILFLRAKLGECVVLWFASWTPPPLKWLTEQKNPFEVCKHAARYNEFGCKLLVCLLKPSVFLVSFVAI